MALQVGIVGAGLSGLACALELEKQGVEVTLFDQSTQAGGRVKTDVVDGFLLDHGFQVYLTSYDAGKYFFDYEGLELGEFESGACLVNNQVKSIMADPTRSPLRTFDTLMNSKATFKDKLLILKLKGVAAKTNEIDTKLNAMTTKDYLLKFGFSKKIIQNFFQPFFAGVFLETKLKTPAGYFLFLFAKFGTGVATLPKAGMQDLALQLQRRLKRNIVFGHRAVQVSKSEIVFDDENKYNFDHVVLASDISTLSKLGFAETDRWNSVTTSYFKTKSKALTSKFLYLNTSENKYVNHVACLSAAQPSYAPEGWHLFSVNCIGIDLSSEGDATVLMDDLKKMFGAGEIEQWQFIRSYYIKHALPSTTEFGGSNINKNGVYLCGDYFESPSIQGALMSGYNLAQQIVALNK